jgi:hypothetical protein
MLCRIEIWWNDDEELGGLWQEAVVANFKAFSLKG